MWFSWFTRKGATGYFFFLLVPLVFFFFLHAMIASPPSLGLVDSGKLLFHGGADFTFLRRRPVRGNHREGEPRVRFVGNRVFFLPRKRERGRLHAFPCRSLELGHHITFHALILNPYMSEPGSYM